MRTVTYLVVMVLGVVAASAAPAETVAATITLADQDAAWPTAAEVDTGAPTGRFTELPWDQPNYDKERDVKSSRPLLQTFQVSSVTEVSSIYVVYRVGTAQAGAMHLVWLDRSGDSTSVDPGWEIRPVQAGNWSGAALSPDGSRVVGTDGTGGGAQLWVKDLEANAPPYRITFDGSFHVRPRWMPGGESVSFISNLGGPEAPTQVWAKAADGSGAARQLAASDVEIEEAVVSPDGDWLVYRQGGTAVGRDIYVRRLAEDSVGRPLIATDADEKSPQLSPDGRWIAYTSDETGQLEVFVRPFPDVAGGKWQVSLGGGFSPLWANNGSELFYVGARTGIRMMAARLDLRASSLAVTGREALFPISDQYVDQNYTAFDTDLDDQRFLMLSFGAGEEGNLVWVRNWVTEWQRRVGESR